VNGGKPPDPPPTETPPGESSDMDISSPIGNNSIYNNKRAVSIVEQVNKKIIAERLQETQQKIGNENIPKQTVDRYCCTDTGPFQVDFNAHHVAWGNEFDDTYGKHLLEAIEKCNLVFINNGSRTLATSQRHIAIDITLCSSDISHSFSWSTLDDPHGSDHLPIIIETNCMYPTGETKTHKIWNLKKANWSQYQTTLETKDPPVYYHQLIDAINEAATISIPKNSTVRHSQHIPKPWWNSECDSAVNNRKEAYIRFKLNPNQENLLEYKKQDATAKKTFKQSQRQSWRMYCESLNRTTPMKDVWQKVNRFKNRRLGNTTRMDPEAEWVEKFHHKIAPNTANTAPISQVTETAMGNHSLSKNFEMWELNRALKQTSNTAPGKDNITYSMLYHLPEGLKKSLLNIFNRIWNNEIAIPTEWKDYLVIPILKHGKPKEEENSYRPISLASCILKTFERMLKNRLEHWLEHHTKLPASQYGFRRNWTKIFNGL
ncbi:putative RNA-directed DNA polymerase from transposon X-element, partial [Gonioctena quinquepunctata]